MDEPWVCPWGICNHEQAQACRADTHKGKYGASGCGGRFQPGTTPEQARRMIEPPLRTAGPPDTDDSMEGGKK